MLFKRNIVLIMVLILMFLTGCGSQKGGAISQRTQPSSEQVKEQEEKEPIIPKAKNPLTGVDMDLQFEKQRPLAVMIENEYNARPQSGLDKAGIVYEILTEGGITRFLALFLGETLDEIGPVRSARPYFLDYTMEYDGIYIHYGASPQGYVDLKKLKINAINGMYDSATFWRDNSRKEPHNAYISTERALKTSKKLGFLKDVDICPWNFYDEDTPVGQHL